VWRIPFQNAEFVWNAFRMLDKLRRKQEISGLKHKASEKHRQHTETYGFLVFTMVRDTRWGVNLQADLSRFLDQTSRDLDNNLQKDLKINID